MNIRCPHCQTVFRINPERIPAKGARARCARCGETFTVQAPTSAATGGAAGPAAGPVPPPARPPGPPPTPPSFAPRAAPAGPPPGSPAPAAGAREPAGAAVAAGTQARPSLFGQRDPAARAQRLARALVSDIVAYHPERRDESLERGNLRTEFREEIMKSWEEYVAQVGLDMAKSTPYFRDALNSILAKGQPLF
jgi:predicted Zn finger-like uncharacterized protein